MPAWATAGSLSCWPRCSRWWRGAGSPMSSRRCRALCSWSASGWSASTTWATSSTASAPTLAFLAAIFVVAEVAERAGLFACAAAWMGARRRTRARLVVAVSTRPSLVTVLMSLDATAVLFTPVVIALVRARRRRAGPSLLATTQLANAASSLLPVSNLTNLLVFSATGLTFGGFAVRMALPTAAASAVVVGTVVRRHASRPRSCRSTRRAARPPRRLRLLRDRSRSRCSPSAFFASSALGVEPAWIAAAGAARARRRRDRAAAGATVGGRARRRRPRSCCSSSASRWWSQAARSITGCTTSRVDVLPAGDGLLALLAMAGLAAVLANLVNNLPATLVLVSVVPAGSTALLLALLVGVNVGPNLTYTGSLATLLWRRVVRREGVEPARRAFFRLAALTTPAALVAATVGLWLSLRVLG